MGEGKLLFPLDPALLQVICPGLLGEQVLLLGAGKGQRGLEVVNGALGGALALGAAAASAANISVFIAVLAHRGR